MKKFPLNQRIYYIYYIFLSRDSPDYQPFKQIIPSFPKEKLARVYGVPLLIRYLWIIYEGIPHAMNQ